VRDGDVRHLRQRHDGLRDGGDAGPLTEPLPPQAHEGREDFVGIAEVEPEELRAELRFVTQNLGGDVRVADATDQTELDTCWRDNLLSVARG